MTKRDLEYQRAFGNHLRKLREAVGWTQIDLSVVSRINESHISQIERGATGPNLQSLRAFAIALGKEPADLLSFDFDLKLNTNFALQGRRVRGPKTTSFVKKLVADGFFKKPKSVSEVLQRCKSDFNVTLVSNDTSGALIRLAERGVLKKIKTDKSVHTKYQTTS